MDETYPIYLSGEHKGMLTLTHSGLYTEFYARCEDPGELMRLSVYGGGREGYLGVMEPVGGVLILRRKLSRAAMTDFPAPIEYAAPTGEKKTESAAPEPAPMLPEEPKNEDGEPPPRSAEPNTDLLWYQAGDGSLVTTWQGRQYRAFPMASWGLPMERAVEKRVIDGVEYAVFALTDSQIV